MSGRVFGVLFVVFVVFGLSAGIQIPLRENDKEIQNQVGVPVRLPIDSKSVSVSGLSSGGFFASQFHVAFSSHLVGAGIFAGGPFYCAEGSLTTAEENCMAFPIFLNVQKLISKAKDYANQGAIDQLGNLTNSKVFLYSGILDTVVNQKVVKGTLAFYQAFVQQQNIKDEFSIASEHCLPTDKFGNSCPSLGSPYINNCNFDGAGATLNHIYSNLSPRSSQIQDNIHTISQSKYVPSGHTTSSLSLSSSAFVYIPTGCKNSTKANTCKLHIVFHGCQQTTADIGNDYYVHGGYNEWAEANNIVVLYPQTVKSYFLPSNPEGCYDWWGYTNGDYSVKSGPQMETVYNMMNAFLSQELKVFPFTK